MKTIYALFEAFFYVLLGGILYFNTEILYRGHSHYSMFLCGGIVFYCISLFNRIYDTKVCLLIRMIVSSIIITSIELLFGILFNLYLNQHVWDYSNQFLNYKGQICLGYSILWFFLSLPILYFEQILRHRLNQRQIVFPIQK